MLGFTWSCLQSNTEDPNAVNKDKTADPVRDDAAYRRMKMANRSSVPKHFTTPSGITMSSASPEPSVISDRGRYVLTAVI